MLEERMKLPSPPSYRVEDPHSEEPGTSLDMPLAATEVGFWCHGAPLGPLRPISLCQLPCLLLILFKFLFEKESGTGTQTQGDLPSSGSLSLSLITHKGPNHSQKLGQVEAMSQEFHVGLSHG